MAKVRIEHFMDEQSGKYYSDAYLIGDDGARQILGATGPIFDTLEQAAEQALDRLRATFPDEMFGEEDVRVIPTLRG